MSNVPLQPKTADCADGRPEDKQHDTYQVTVKVDPSEVSKVSVNISEQAPDIAKPIEDIANDQDVEAVKHIDLKALEPTSSDQQADATGYEAEEQDDSQSSIGKKKKKNRKKKQNVKPEDVPSADPKSTEGSGKEQSDLISSGNENDMPEEEHLPEGREGILSPDESCRSLSEIEDTTVRILEESVITSPRESIQIERDSGVIYPGEVIEVTYVDDSEQQTEPIQDNENAVKAPIEIDTKEVQAAIETTENETQMSPRAEFENIPEKETAEISIQTIITQFIESESQTIADLVDIESKPKQEQECQTETIDGTKNQESSMQTIPVVTKDEIAQTEDPQKANDANKISELMVTEIILKAVQSSQEPIELVSQKTEEQVEVPAEKDVSDYVEQQKPTENVSLSKEESQSKKKKNKKQKSKDDKKELEIQATIDIQQPDVSQRSQIAVSLGPDSSNTKNIDVHVTVERPVASAPPLSEVEDVNNAVLQRLNYIMQIETNEPPKDKQNFALSQNLNNLINNIDQQGLEVVPWNEVQYMIDANIENRRINNNSTLR